MPDLKNNDDLEDFLNDKFLDYTYFIEKIYIIYDFSEYAKLLKKK